MSATLSRLECYDGRFPTSRTLAGSDALNLNHDSPDGEQWRAA